ncbi:hypothetical protein K438DRAFT_1765590 [Mycena galopus ATCC 62051]|nr:hypothetical protein K438DRAFT_1765590 [Mycena galopus ATCC 62051]
MSFPEIMAVMEPLNSEPKLSEPVRFHVTPPAALNIFKFPHFWLRLGAWQNKAHPEVQTVYRLHSQGVCIGLPPVPVMATAVESTGGPQHGPWDTRPLRSPKNHERDGTVNGTVVTAVSTDGVDKIQTPPSHQEGPATLFNSAKRDTEEWYTRATAVTAVFQRPVEAVTRAVTVLWLSSKNLRWNGHGTCATGAVEPW